MRSIRNCNVALVGACGFLGSHAARHLTQDRGCEVLALDNLEAGRREFLPGGAHFVYCDITGPEEYLLRLFKAYKVKYVLNYAAIPYVPYSFDRPLHVANVNFFGACKVINAAHEAGCEGILQISTAELYGGDHYGSPVNDGFDVSIDEDFPVRPHSTYGASKAAVDFYVQSRWREARVPAIALRQFNCLGERETHPYVVPEIISQLSRRCKGDTSGAAGVPIVRLGNNAARDFLYAGDQARMAVELLERGQWGEVYNLGSERSIKVYDLACLIAKVMGFQTCEVVPDPARVRPWEIWSLKSDSAKSYSVIESRPTVSLEEALRRTVNDYVTSGRQWAWEK